LLDDCGVVGLRRRMPDRRPCSPRRKLSFANSHRSGTTFRKPCIDGCMVAIDVSIHCWSMLKKHRLIKCAAFISVPFRQPLNNSWSTWGVINRVLICMSKYEFLFERYKKTSRNLEAYHHYQVPAYHDKRAYYCECQIPITTKRGISCWWGKGQ